MSPLRSGFFALVLMVSFVALPGSCTTVQPPPAGDPAATKDINCGKEVLQHAIASTTGRVNSILAEAVTLQNAKQVGLKNLTSLAVEVGPEAVACAVQYLASKLGFNAQHADTPEQRANFGQRVDIARAFIEQQGYTFASGPPPN